MSIRDQAITIYPNPFFDNVELISTASAKDLNVIVKNLDGKILYQKNYLQIRQNTPISLNFINFSSAVYILTAIDLESKKIYNYKIVKI